MNKLIVSLFASFLALSAQADSGAFGLMKSLATALPPNTSAYVGKNNGRLCFVKVDALPGPVYVVTVGQQTKAGDVQKVSFAINPASRVSNQSYVSRMSEYIETSVEVETGRMIQYENTYGSFAEMTMGLEIRKNNEVSSQTARKIWVTNRKAGKIGASGPACIIEIKK